MGRSAGITDDNIPILGTAKLQSFATLLRVLLLNSLQMLFERSGETREFQVSRQ